MASLVKIKAMDKELKNATDKTMLQKAKTLIKGYAAGVDSSPEETQAVKALRRKIALRENALLKNSKKLPSRQNP